jgi:hypothetical protein
MNSVPCVAVSLPIGKERELNVRLNKNSGEWDWDKLANEFDMSDLVNWGFDPEAFGVPQSYIDSVSDIEILNEDDSFGISFVIKCSDYSELEEIMSVFGTNNKSISFDSAQEVLCQSR